MDNHPDCVCGKHDCGFNHCHRCGHDIPGCAVALLVGGKFRKHCDDCVAFVELSERRVGMLPKEHARG